MYCTRSFSGTILPTRHLSEILHFLIFLSSQVRTVLGTSVIHSDVRSLS